MVQDLDRRSVWEDAAARAGRYIDEVASRRVSPSPEAVAALARFDPNLPEGPTSPTALIAELDELGSPATVAATGGRYFGYVTGSILPAAAGASALAAAWNQNAGLRVMSPTSCALEDLALAWTVDLLGLPAGTGGALVTGATMANFTAMAAARHAMLARQGWNVEDQGLFGAPPIQVVVGEEVHASMLKALSMIGFGKARVIRIPVDGQGRMRPEMLPPLNDRTILCLQAGNVNTGAFDPAHEIIPAARSAGAWVHVDGAFGLWAAVSPHYRHWTSGYEHADSWALDAHKWPNAGYDSGVALVREPKDLAASMAMSAAYLHPGSSREPLEYTPDMSRRARGIEFWAALRSLGKSGFADLIDRTCRHAARFAEGLRHAGFQILNDVVINQVLVSFGSADQTSAVIAGIQREGTCWCGGTVWQGHTAMRISVSSWATKDEDVEASLGAMIRIAREI